MLNEFQWLGISAIGKQSHRITDIASDRPALIYLGGIIAYKTFNLYSEVKKYYNSKIKIDSDSNLYKQKYTVNKLKWGKVKA